ncbi:MAG: carboxymuconolactone decarboxylase family protein [Candidatus Hodarchaeales archaeon]
MKVRKRIKSAFRSGRISDKFREHIFLAVTSVNGCIYCEWGHTRLAFEAGSTKEEIRSILSLNLDKLPEHELIALAFAQHYAESGSHPSKEALKKLVDTYGHKAAQDIIIICQMITMGNLLGNTVSAFKSRLVGKPPKKGSFLFELLVYILGGFWMDRIIQVKS